MAFHCIVCIKATALKAPGKGAIKNSDSAQMNPFDRIALARARDIAAARRGRITALSMGPPTCAFVLHEAMALGADRGVLLCDNRLADSDTLATSSALAAAVKKMAPWDLVIFGARTADSDTGQVGPQTATALDLPLLTGVLACQWKNKTLLVERKIDEFRETYELDLPSALTIHPSSILPPDIALGGVEEAWGKEITLLTLDDIGLQADRVGLTGSPTRVSSLKRAVRERHCEFIEGTAEEQADTLLRKIGAAGTGS